MDTLARELEHRSLLLLLDNFEQVQEAATELVPVIRAATGLKVVVTSRSPLRLSAEREYPVPPLTEAEAVVLFAERAQAAKPAYVLDGNRLLVAEICRRLDRLPLAIELAAARMKVLPEKALLDRLGERLKLLSGGARDLQERQRTLRATIDWSHQLLGEGEQRLFRRLAVFAGGRSLDAIEDICYPEAKLDALEIVASLVDKSLLRQEEQSGGEARFVMLETIHEFAREQLEASGEADGVKRRHATFYCAVAEEAAPELEREHTSNWLSRLEQEHDNLRAALDYLAAAGEHEDELRLATALRLFYNLHNHLREGDRRLEGAVRRAEAAAVPVHPELHQKALSAWSTFTFRLGRYDEAEQLAERAHELASACGADRYGPRANLALIVAEAGNHERAIQLSEELLASPLPEPRRADVLLNLMIPLTAIGAYNRAKECWSAGARTIHVCRRPRRRFDNGKQSRVRRPPAWRTGSRRAPLSSGPDARPRPRHRPRGQLRTERHSCGPDCPR